MMERIVGRDILRGHRDPDSHDLVRRDLGHGHLEYAIVPVTTWELIGVLSDQAWADRQAEMAATADDRRQDNLRRAARRAQKRVRHLCKAAGVDTLLTLTYRANVTDLDVCKRHLKAFNRKMAAVLPGWFYVAAFERQQRGAWHVHMAVHRLPRELPLSGKPAMHGGGSSGVKLKSFNVIRAVWRSVTGEAEGNIDLSARKRNSKRAPSRMAAYLAKYMLKAFEDGDAWANRFSSSKTVSVPKPERIRFHGYSMTDVARMVFDDLPAYATEQLGWGLTRFKDGLWFVLDANIRWRRGEQVDSWEPA